MLGIVLALVLFDTNVKNIKTDRDVTGVVFSVVVVSILILALIWSGIRVNRIENTLHEVMIETAKATSLVFIILLGAAMLTAAFRAFGGEELVKDYLNSLPGGFWTKFIIVMAVIFVLGFFLDFIEIAVVVVPIVAPILLADPSANITAVWLGVMIGLNIQTSFLTPPFGFALFYLRGVAPAVVKTVNMYKGVIAFIILQIVALGIVGYYPPLVNYLPNRMSLLSETAPPPRNPKLQYCIEEYTAGEFERSGPALLSSIDRMRQLDYSVLPSKLAKSVSGSFDDAENAIALLTAALENERAVKENADSYRPIHSVVRDIELAIREKEEIIDQLETQKGRMYGDSNATARESIDKRVVALKTEIDQLNSNIPAEWEQANQNYVALQKAEAKARADYRRAADSGYSEIAELSEILGSTTKLKELENSLPEMRQMVIDGEPSDLLDPLKELSDSFGDIPGASSIKSAVSKARSALKAKTPKKDKAIASMDKAITEYEEQLQWRSVAEQALGLEISQYEKSLSSTIGIRQQDRLSREQALYVAGCSAEHRDISLNF